MLLNHFLLHSIQIILDFFDWAYHHGASDALSLQYVMLPDDLIQKIETNWKTQFIDEQKKSIWNK